MINNLYKICVIFFKIWVKTNCPNFYSILLLYSVLWQNTMKHTIKLNYPNIQCKYNNKTLILFLPVISWKLYTEKEWNQKSNLKTKPSIFRAINLHWLRKFTMQWLPCIALSWQGEDMRERLVWLEGQLASLSSPLARHSTLWLCSAMLPVALWLVRHSTLWLARHSSLWLDAALPPAFLWLMEGLVIGAALPSAVLCIVPADPGWYWCII